MTDSLRYPNQGQNNRISRTSATPVVVFELAMNTNLLASSTYDAVISPSNSRPLMVLVFLWVLVKCLVLPVTM